MANSSRNPPASQSADLTTRVRRSLAELVPQAGSVRAVVAYSGGVDSRVLLQLCVELGLATRAIHVDHQLQSVSADWQQHCIDTCAALDVPLQCFSVDAKSASRESPEAAARDARYRALLDAVANDEVLLLAQHQDDQAETVLLQLLRGAGAAGLSAMAARSHRQNSHGDDITVLRPLLDTRRADILGYARAQQLSWVDDPSNADTDIRRNAIRHDLMPVLRQLAPDVDTQLSTVAEQQQQTASLLDELAKFDLENCEGTSPHVITVDYLLSLSEERQFNLLRFWLHRQGSRPNRKCIQQIMCDVVTAADDAVPQVRWGRSEVRRFDGQLFLLSAGSTMNPDADAQYRWCPTSSLTLMNTGQVIAVQQDVAEGLHNRYLTDELTVRFRQGGERIMPRGNKQHQALKKLFQQSRIPPWERDRIPLLYLGDELLAVGSVWLSEPHCSTQGENGWMPVVT